LIDIGIVFAFAPLLNLGRRQCVATSHRIEAGKRGGHKGSETLQTDPLATRGASEATVHAGP
jgi:hypothetical protein